MHNDDHNDDHTTPPVLGSYRISDRAPGWARCGDMGGPASLECTRALGHPGDHQHQGEVEVTSTGAVLGGGLIGWRNEAPGAAPLPDAEAVPEGPRGAARGGVRAVIAAALHVIERSSPLTPLEVNTIITAALLADSEMHATLAAMHAAGARVDELLARTRDFNAKGKHDE
jgi:hypothetical protein